jgi:transcription factor IIIB 90 kDa subunit
MKSSSTRPHVPARRNKSRVAEDSPLKPLPSRRLTERKCCFKPDIRDDDGYKVCFNCGQQISENNIVSEVTFAENSLGAAVVQGGTVGENQRHARFAGPGGRRMGGGEPRNFSQETASTEVSTVMTMLNIRSDTLREQALKIYDLAINAGFIQGRRPRAVAAACVYLVCRRSGKHTILLMDFAEKIRHNVFKLGNVYKELMDTLYIDDKPASGVAPVLEIERVIEKYCERLEFGDRTLRVADDAVAIIRRMNRDWIVDGRQPAGLIGACIILAARMNNFRRTVREVVFVVKVCDATIAQRLVEFNRTQASTLSVQEFRKNADSLPDAEKPPAIYNAEVKAKRRHEKLAKLHLLASSGVTGQGDEIDGQKNMPRKHVRIDKDGFLIPDTPVDPVLLGESEQSKPGQKRKRGRPSKKSVGTIRPDSRALAEEAALEEEIEQVLHDPAAIESADQARAEMPKRTETEYLRPETPLNPDYISRDPDVSENEDEDEDVRRTRIEKHAAELASKHRNPELSYLDKEEIEDDEFDEDPEVASCVLTEAESEIKAKIWVTQNEEWLRDQQAKHLKRTLEEVQGGPKKAIRRRKKSKRNLEDEPPTDDTAEKLLRAIQREKGRLPKSFSKHVNYENLNKYYGRGSSKTLSSASASPSVAGSSPSPEMEHHTRNQGPPSTAQPLQHLPSQHPHRESITEIQQQIHGEEDDEIVEDIETEPVRNNQAGSQSYDDYDEEEDYNDAIDPISNAYGVTEEYGEDDDAEEYE